MIAWMLAFAVFCTALGFVTGKEYQRKYGDKR
jgi:hypothetical protein